MKITIVFLIFGIALQEQFDSEALVRASAESASNDPINNILRLVRTKTKLE